MSAPGPPVVTLAAEPDVADVGLRAKERAENFPVALRVLPRAVRADLRAEREDRARQEAEAAEERERQREIVDAQLARLNERVEFLSMQLRHWKSLARVMAGWATSLRDEVLRLGGTLPAEPEELLTLQAIIDAGED